MKSTGGHQRARIEKGCDYTGTAWRGFVEMMELLSLMVAAVTQIYIHVKIQRTVYQKARSMLLDNWNENFTEHQKDVRK